MSDTWIVYETQDKPNIKNEKGEQLTVMPSFHFFNYYLKLLIKDRDTALFPDRITLHIDDAIYSSAFILDSFHNLYTYFPEYLKNIDFIFHGKNKALCKTYQNIINNMRKHLNE